MYKLNAIHNTLHAIYYIQFTNTLHCTQYTVQYTQYNIYYEIYTINYKLYTIHYTLYTPLEDLDIHMEREYQVPKPLKRALYPDGMPCQDCQTKENIVMKHTAKI